jgi:hypothetical protein
MEQISKDVQPALRTGFIQDTRELVIVCGYSVSGLYGYFICWETLIDGVHLYTDPIAFEQKTTEASYTRLIGDLNRIIAAYKR